MRRVEKMGFVAIAAARGEGERVISDVDWLKRSMMTHGT